MFIVSSVSFKQKIRIFQKPFLICYNTFFLSFGCRLCEDLLRPLGNAVAALLLLEEGERRSRRRRRRVWLLWEGSWFVEHCINLSFRSDIRSCSAFEEPKMDHDVGQIVLCCRRTEDPQMGNQLDADFSDSEHEVYVTLSIEQKR